MCVCVHIKERVAQSARHPRVAALILPGKIENAERTSRVFFATSKRVKKKEAFGSKTKEISSIQFTLLEKTMAKLGEGDQRWIVEERKDGANVHGWHWVEKDCKEWTRVFFESEFVCCGDDVNDDGGETKTGFVFGRK